MLSYIALTFCSLFLRCDPDLRPTLVCLSWLSPNLRILFRTLDGSFLILSSKLKTRGWQSCLSHAYQAIGPVLVETRLSRQARRIRKPSKCLCSPCGAIVFLGLSEPSAKHERASEIMLNCAFCFRGCPADGRGGCSYCCETLFLSCPGMFSRSPPVLGFPSRSETKQRYLAVPARFSFQASLSPRWHRPVALG